MTGRFSISLLLPLLGFVCGTFPGCERNWGGADTTPPAVAYARWVDDTHVDVEFDEEVEQSSAENETNYSIAEAEDPSEPLSVTEAHLQEDYKTVRLTTAVQRIGTAYTVAVVHVEDLAGNPLSGNNTAEFTNEGVQTYPTYNEDIQPILDSKCISCHGTMASKPLTTYAEVMVFVENGTLKQKAEGGHQTFDEASSQMVIDWINAGAPEH